MLSKQELENMSKWQLHTPPNSELQELSEIYIDNDLPPHKRFISFFEQIGNPYCFLVNGSRVRLSFSNHNKKTLDDSLFNYLMKIKNSDSKIL